MPVTLYHVNAFTDQFFGGNPAAICPLSRWLDDSLMQSIAVQNALPVTAFFVNNKNSYDIRWFTPLTELNLCGHATLACAFVIFNYLDPDASSVTFNCSAGPLHVTRMGDSISMDFPIIAYHFLDERMLMAQILGLMPREIYKAEEDYMVVLYKEEQVRNFEPNFELLAKLEARGIAITARGKNVDFVSRWFGPRIGVNEDLVTGSAHCMLMPYWSGQLGKTKLVAEQLSARGGKLQGELKGDRVMLTSKAILYLKGQIFLESCKSLEQSLECS